MKFKIIKASGELIDKKSYDITTITHLEYLYKLFKKDLIINFEKKEITIYDYYIE